MIRNLPRISAALVLLSLCAACSPPTAQELLDEARTALAAGEVSTASIHLRNLLQQEPGNTAARAMLAEVALALGDSALAEQSARRAIAGGADPVTLQITLLQALAGQGKYEDIVGQVEAGPDLIGEDRAIALGILGTAQRNLGNAEEAEAAFREALELNPESGELQTQLGAVLFGIGNRDEAWKLLSDALRREPDNVGALLIRGAIEVAMGAPEAAERSFREVIGLEQGGARRSNDYLNALARLVELQLNQDELDEASKNADELLAATPEHPLARLAKAAVEVREGNLESAEERLELIIADAPEFWLAYRWKGIVDARQGQFGQAEANLRRAVNNNPGDAVARLQLADVYARQGKLEEARRLFQGSASATQDDSLFIALAGGASLSIGETDLAQSYFGQAEQLKAESVQQLAGITNVFIAAGEFDRAVRLIESMSFDDTESQVAAGSLLGLVRLFQGDTPAAIEIADRLIDGRPGLSWPYILRGLIGVSQEDYDNAREHFETALTLDPSSESALYNLARIALLRGDLQDASEHLERIVAIDPNQPNALLALSDIALRGGHYEDARRIAEQAPDSTLRYVILGRIAEAAGNFRDAASAYGRAFAAQPSLAMAMQSYRVGAQAGEPDPEEELLAWVAIRPLDAEANALLGSVELDRGNWEQAVDRFERIVELNPSHAAALNNLAWLYSKLGDDRAVRFGERAYEAAPDNAAIADTLGWLYLERGSAERARPLLEQAAGELPNEPEVQYHWAMVLSAEGDVAGAVEILDPIIADGAEFAARSEAEEWLRQHQN